jgi:hypothetical protein
MDENKSNIKYQGQLRTVCCREYVNLRRTQQEAGENCIEISFIMHSGYKILSG